MAGTRKDVKARIASVKNIHKITRAMQMVAAARLRKAEERIEQLRPYGRAIRLVSRQAAALSEGFAEVPLLKEHDEVKRVGILVISGDRGLAGAFNTNILREALRLRDDYEARGRETELFAVGRRGTSSLAFRGFQAAKNYIGITDRPRFANAREIAEDLATAYEDGRLDRVDVVYNHYISALNQVVTQERLLPLEAARIVGGHDDQVEEELPEELSDPAKRGLWEYEPEPHFLLRQLAIDAMQIAVFRALLESTASEHGARMTAMRTAAENAEEMIESLTLEMNRVRQAEITQEILEVVGGAEALA